MTLLMALVCLMLTSGCAHTANINAVGWNELEGQSVQLAVQSMKVKRGKADVTVAVRNKYPFTVVVPQDSIRFAVENTESLGGTTNRRLVLKSGDSTVARLHFTIPQGQTEKPGAVLTLEHIYAGQETIATAGSASASHVPGQIVPFFRLRNPSTHAQVETHQEKTAIEGQRLPQATVHFTFER